MENIWRNSELNGFAAGGMRIGMKRNMSVVLALSCTLLLSAEVIARRVPDKTTVEKEMGKLQGSWQVVRWEGDELASPGEMKHLTFEFQGDRLTVRTGQNEPSDHFQYSVDPSKQPKWLDVRMPGQLPESPVLNGIYKLEGDELTICVALQISFWGEAAPARPSEFKTNLHDEYSLLVLKKVKP